ncbi:type IX secretion system anionic LPS delivery protein PorZ [Belliella pelovolcani]|uniref:Por secretion system C-terminal sorting domain-containing protein n=1 Tax=Belliella pelovolcani TaxID=529505 RepID=A0A1N7N5Y3_9BACT|nr:two-component regulator propeller domain-containing protein [Belliella pelovolcani]SIS93813.1 Por secretion system C-terminal sorting domain-containing protein [Belliella pelovolcani]
MKNQTKTSFWTCVYSKWKFILGLSLYFVFSFSNSFTFAQSKIPVGAWRTQASYLDPARLTGSDQTVFHIGKESLFYFSTTSKETFQVSKLDGLYAQQFTNANFDEIEKKLIITYADGSIDLLGENNIRNIATLRNNTQISEKGINRVKKLSVNTFLAADFGVAIINSRNNQFVDAFINIGPNASTLAVFDITEDSENYYLATAMGVLIGNKSSNLRDFRNWNLLDLGSQNRYQQIEYYENTLFALSKEGEVFVFENGNAIALLGISNAKNLKRFPQGLFFQSSQTVYQVQANGSYSTYLTWEESFDDFHITSQHTYLSITGKGLLDSADGSTFSPNGPQTKVQAFAFDRSGSYALPFFRQSNGQINASSGNQSSKLFSGNWSEIDQVENILAIQSIGSKTFFASRNQGLWISEDNELSQIILNGVNPNTPIRTIQADAMGQLWVGLEDNQGRLIKIRDDSQSSIQVTGLSFPQKIEVDNRGNLWILQSNNLGNTSIRVFNEDSQLNRSLSTSPNQGGLPNSSVRDIKLDGENRLWIGLSNGIVFLPNVASIQNSTAINVVQPLFQNQPLLAGEMVTAIAISPDQNLWLGTNSNGLFQFTSEGLALITHFTNANSPLFTNQISNLQFNNFTGELLITTPAGGQSYRSGSIAPSEQLGDIKIFPNPIRPDFNGLMTIEGLTDFTEIKISNTAGRVVFSNQVRGGSFTWNVRDLSGKRPIPGVYLVFVIDEIGRERIAGKFVIL